MRAKGHLPQPTVILQSDKNNNNQGMMTKVLTFQHLDNRDRMSRHSQSAADGKLMQLKNTQDSPKKKIEYCDRDCYTLRKYTCHCHAKRFMFRLESKHGAKSITKDQEVNQSA